MYNLPVDVMDSKTVHETFPAFHLDDDEIGVYEHEAGYVTPEQCISAYLRKARRHNAQLHFNESVVKWEVQHNTTSSSGDDASLVHVITSLGRHFFAKKLILAVGTWASEVYGEELSLPLTIQRRVLFWFEPLLADSAQRLTDTNSRNGSDGESGAIVKQGELHNIVQNQIFCATNHGGKMPVFYWDLGNTYAKHLYGFPIMASEGDVSRENGLSPQGIKVAFHLIQGGDQADRGLVSHPEKVDRIVSDEEIAEVRDQLRGRIDAAATGTLVHSTVCMYTMTPDEHL